MWALLFFASLPDMIADRLRDGWFIVGAGPEHTSFARGGSLTGPRDERRVEVVVVLPRTINGAKQKHMEYTLNCSTFEIQTTRFEFVGADGRSLGEGDKAVGWKPIQPNTLGEVLYSFSCKAWENDWPEIGYGTLLSLEETADHYQRLVGIGLSANVAGAIAGMDAVKAPVEFKKMLHTFVPTDKQLMVRVIKDPNAKDD